MRAALAIGLCLWAGALSAAVSLDLPGSASRTAQTSETGRVALPEGAWANGALPARTGEGRVTRSAWRVEGAGTSIEALLAPLRDQLEGAGYAPVFQCMDRSCGGYDFRFALDLLPAPAMFVDLGAYGYLLAEGPEGRLVSVLASRARQAGYVHITEVGEGESETVVSSSMTGKAVPQGPLWSRLRSAGRAPLDDLDFGSGAAALAGGPFDSLAALAEGLRSDPAARIALVGHTDTKGGLEANMALSAKRAEAVRQTLIDTYGADPARIEARGVGYFAPRTANDTAEGRDANRRVEAVLID